MKNVLVLVVDYPNNAGGVAMMYVHSRNLFYVKHNINVTVLNFSATVGYVKDGIKVISLNEYKKSKEIYDVLILHAANIRNHYLFVTKYGNNFKHIIFFFHGHEVLKLNKTYPKPYEYMIKKNIIRYFFQDMYDSLKLAMWRKYLPKIAYKADYIFVSNTFFEEFKKSTKLTTDDLLNHVHIINNSIGEIFENNKYNPNSKKKYDFITIRNLMDQSVYCIDLLCRIAKNNPDKKFLLIGKGHYFEYNNRPENIVWIDEYLNQAEMLHYIDEAKCALMLTRRDTQGVMSCELVSYGIPLITSDIPVCHEIFDGISSVSLIENYNIDNDPLILPMNTDNLVSRYNGENTVLKEVQLILK